MPSIFLSYRHSDTAGHAGRIYDRLVERFGRSAVFKDVDSMEPGAAFAVVIEETISQCNALIAVIGPHWLPEDRGAGRWADRPRDWVRFEIATALKAGIRVVPVLVHNATMPEQSDLPDDLQELASRHAVHLSETAWSEQLARLIDALSAGMRADPERLARRSPPARALVAAAILPVAVALAVVLALRGDGDHDGDQLAVKPSPGGCITEQDGAHGCAVGDGLYGAVAVSPSRDGQNVYVASYDNSAVAILDRDRASGTLSSRSDRSRCLARNGAAGACIRFDALDGTEDVAVSGDDRNVYAASSTGSNVTTFVRDATDGGLAAAPRGCLGAKEPSCTHARAMRGADAIAVSDDDRNVYVTAYDSDAIDVLDRADNGKLTQKSGPAGCLSERDDIACASAAALDGPEAVAVSPHGDSVYVASSRSDAVAVFERGPDGSLTMKPGKTGFVAARSTRGRCGLARALAVGDAANAIAVSPDGRHVYVASEEGASVIILDRDSDGGLTPKTGRDGCISSDGSRGCAPVPVLDGAWSVTIAPDSETAFVASPKAGTIAALSRDDGSGALTLEPGPAHCVSSDGTAGRCGRAPTLADARMVALSPDGRQLYVASYEGDAVTVLDRR